MLHNKYNGYSVHLVEDIKEIELIKGHCSQKVSVGLDVETTGLDFYDDYVVGVCVSCGKGYSQERYHGFYLPINHVGYNNLPTDKVVELVQWLIDNFVTVWWNRDFDAMMLEKLGIKFPCPGKTHDAQCMAHLIKGDSFPALKDFAHDYLKMDVIHFSENNAKNSNFGTTDPRISYIYSSQDSLITVLLARKIWTDYPYIRKIYPLDNKFAECMRRIMYSTELYLDKDKVEKMLEINARELADVKQKIFSLTGYQFRLDSNRDKSDALLRVVTLTAKTAGGQYKVDKEVLEEIDHPLAKLLLKYANLTKFRSTYLQKFKDFPQPFHINYQHCNVACLTENNKVRTSQGIKSIRDVQVGDFILAENGFFPVTGKQAFVDKCLRVKFRNGAFIEGNTKHPVLVGNEWVKLGDLRIKDRVTTCRGTHCSYNSVKLPDIEWSNNCKTKVRNFSTILDVELAQLLGFIDGDGSLVSDGVKLCFSAFEPEVEEFYTKLFSLRFNIPIPARSVDKDNTIQYKFCSTDLSRWLRALGVKPHGEEPGLDVSSWSSECQFAYVAALFDTDGSLTKQSSQGRYNLVLAMTSKACIDNATEILRFHGIDVHRFSYSKNRRQVLYSLRVRTFKRYELFYHLIGKHMRCAHKVDRLVNCVFDFDNSYNRWRGKEFSVEVSSIEEVGEMEVFDIVVGTDHTFIANGLVTHNTGRMSSGGSKGNSFFAPLNIQNIPKKEVMRYLHHDSTADLKYRMDDNPFQAISGKIQTPDGEVNVSTLKQGDKVCTSKGIKEVISITPIEVKLVKLISEDSIIECEPDSFLRTPVGITIKAKDSVVEKSYEVTTGYYIDLGDDIYSVRVYAYDVQIRTLMKIKTKGGMRDCFVPPPGYLWISQDYSSEEVVVLANLSNEPVLIEPLLQGADIHKFVATKMFGHYDPTHRTLAKTVTFCPTNNVLIQTPDGLFRPSELGSRVLTQYNEVVNVLHNEEFEGPTITVEYSNGCCETYHNQHNVQVLTSKGREWKEVRNLSDSDAVLYCPGLLKESKSSWIINESDYLYHRKSEKSYDFSSHYFAYLIGLYLGDGCLTGSGKTVHGDYKSWQLSWVVNQYCESFFLEACSALSIKISINRVGNGYKVFVTNNNALGRAVNEFFGRTKTKHLSDEAYKHWSKFEVKYFIAGLIDSDGYASDTCVSFQNTNLELIHSVAPIINAYGKATALCEDSAKWKGEKVRFWNLFISDIIDIPVLTVYRKQPKSHYSYERFASHVITDTAAECIKPLRYKKDFSHYDNILRHRSPVYPTDTEIREKQGTLNVLTTKVISIKDSGVKKCFIIKVEGGEYLTGVVSHNCSNYGGSGHTIARRLGIPVEEGNALLEKYNKTLSKAYQWKQEIIKEGRRKGMVFTYFGRPRAVYMYFNSSNPKDHGFAERTCMNSPIQGTSGDIIRIDHVKYYSLINPESPSYDKEFAENTKYAITVHDEINLFVKPHYLQKACEKLRSIMEMKFPNWKVPLKVSPSAGTTWGTQIEFLGFTEDGTIIPDCEEDLSLL